MELRKEKLQTQFADFLEQAELDEPPLVTADYKPIANYEAEGLYTLVGEVAALKNEVKQEVRQQKDTLGQFTGFMDTLQGNNQQLSEALQQQKVTQQKAVTDAEKALLNEIIDLYDRLDTTVSSLHQFSAPALERKASREFRHSLQEGLEITLRRTGQLLKQHNISAVKVIGKSVDPHVMRVTEVRDDPGKPDGVVLEEVLRGYQHKGQLFRLAEVVANRRTNSSK